MVGEALGVLIVLGVLTGIGFGPGLLCVGPPARLPRALAVAPALGLALVGILSFPLYRWVGPLRMWTWPLAVILLLISAVLTVVVARRSQGLFSGLGKLALPVGVWLACVGILILPVVLRGIPYAVYRANGADAYIYNSQAQAIQDASWQTLLRGASFADPEGVAELAKQSPTALHSARNLIVPITVNRNAVQAWAGELAGTRAWRFYYPFHLVCFAASAAAVMLLGRLIGLGRGLSSLAGAAAGAGFWARWVLESDAGYQMAATPLLILIAVAWALAEGRREAAPIGPLALLAIALAGMAVFYSPLLQVLVAAVIAYLVISAVTRQFPGRRLLGYAAAGAVAVGIVVITAQADWHFRNGRILAANSTSVFGAGQVISLPLSIIENNGAAGFWGVPPLIIFYGVPQKLLQPLRFLCDAWGVALTLAAGLSAWMLVRRKSDPSHRIVFSFVMAGLMTAALLVVTDRSAADTANYAAGKALTFIYPFPLLLALIYLRWMGEQLTPGQQRGALGVAGSFLAMQLVVGAYMPIKRSHARPFSNAAETKLEDYNLDPILKHLRANPGKLMVWTPKGDRWLFEHYLMYALAEFKPHYGSGLVMDNNPLTPNFRGEPLTEAPDYVALTPRSDFVKGSGMGELAAETPDLLLYRLTRPDLALLRKMEKDLADQENSNPNKVLLIGQPGWKP